MLTQREKDFVRYWEANRLRRKKVVRQFLIGIPFGLLFVIPIVINFSSGWYRRADMEANSPEFNPMVLFVGLLLIVAFTAIFYQRHKWDQYEQRYQELRHLLEREEGAELEKPSNRAGLGIRPTGIRPIPRTWGIRPTPRTWRIRPTPPTW